MDSIYRDPIEQPVARPAPSDRPKITSDPDVFVAIQKLVTEQRRTRKAAQTCAAVLMIWFIVSLIIGAIGFYVVLRATDPAYRRDTDSSYSY